MNITEHDETINDEIQYMIDKSINQIPKPELITITKVHEDNKHVDCKNETDPVFQYIQCIGTPVKGNQGLMFTLNDDTLIIITK